MTDSAAKPLRRIWWRYLLLAFAVLLTVLAIGLWYTTTDSFQAMVRRRVVAELERITGGRVELGSVHAIPFRRRVEIRDLTIHGREPAGEIPYVHVGRFLAEVKIKSALGGDIEFSSVILDSPVVRLIVYPDGSTNQPEPLLHQGSSITTEKLFALSIGTLEVRRGELIVNDKKIPLDLIANDVSANAAYSLFHRQYDGEVLFGKLQTTVDGYRPVSWTAEAHFNVSRNSAAITSFKATSGRSRVEATGTVENFRDPKLAGNYEATLDLAEVAAIMRRRDLQRGTVQLSGTGFWTSADFNTTGKLVVHGFRGYNEIATVSTADGTAEFAADPRRIALSELEARLLGGKIQGTAALTNWLTAATDASPAEQQRGSVKLVVDNISMRDLATAVSTRKRPLSKVDLAGAVSGTVNMRWSGTPNRAQAELALDVVPPSQPSPGQLPVNAHIRASYDLASDTLDLPDLAAVIRATQVRASGTLSSKAAIKLSIISTDLNEWRPLLAAFGQTDRLPVTVHGRASFSGTATGRLSSLVITGNLQAQNFDTLGPATSTTPERQLHWDSFAGNVQLSSRDIAVRNAVLHRGPAVVNFDLNAGLQKGEFADSSPFTAHVNVRNGNVGEMIALAGYNYPVSGSINLTLNAGGTRGNPNAEGHLQLTNGNIYGQPVQRLVSGVRFSAGQATLTNIDLTAYAARVTGGATLTLASGEFRFNLSGSNFDLRRIPQLQATRVSVDGRMNFVAQGSGTVQAPSIDAKLHLGDLTFDGERAGDFDLDVVTRGADMQVSGRSQFNLADLTVSGTVHARGDWPSDINLHFNHLDVDALLRVYLLGRVTGHSAIAGDLQLRGPLLKPRQLNADANLSDVFADIENIKIRNEGPIRFAVTTEAANLQQFHLVGEGTDLAANGSVQLTGERQLDLHARGKVNLHLIESFSPDFTSSGVVSVDLKVGGTMAQPLPEGSLQITHGNIAYIDLPSALSEINGLMVFSHDRLQIQTLTAHTGGGLVTFGGYATLRNRQVNFDLALQGQDVRLRYPPGVSATATADLRWVGTPTGSILSGDVTVTKLAVTTGFDFGAYLQRAAQSSSLPQTNPLLNRIRLDVHIVTTPELQMQTAVIRLSGDADLRLRGTGGKPVLLGRADVLEGEAYFNGSKYRLERGDVTFTNPVTTTPVLDLQAATRVRDYDIILNLNGEVSKLNLTYRSEPPLPEPDIIALLALGRTQEESAQLQQTQTGFSQETSNAILAEALNATLSNRVQRIFGVSRLRVDPQGQTTETSLVRGPQVTIEQQVASNLTLTYSTNVSQTSQQIIQVEYNLTRNVSIVGTRDQNGVVSFDVRIRQRKK